MGSGVYILERQQWVSRLIERVFTFFSDAHNLEELTPPWLTFRIFSLSSATVSQALGFATGYDCIACHFGGSPKS